MDTDTYVPSLLVHLSVVARSERPAGERRMDRAAGSQATLIERDRVHTLIDPKLRVSREDSARIGCAAVPPSGQREMREKWALFGLYAFRSEPLRDSPLQLD